MTELRRAYRRLQAGRDYLRRFIRPQPLHWTRDALSGKREYAEPSFDDIVLHSQHYGWTVQVAQGVAVGKRHVENLVGPEILSYAEQSALRKLAEGLLREDYYVDQDDDVQWQFTVSVSATARVKAWPAVPGITAIPWQPTGFEQRLPLRSDWDLANRVLIPAMYREEHNAYSRGAYRLAWLAEPVTAAVARRMPLPDYFTIIDDERVPREVLRLAEEVS